MESWPQQLLRTPKLRWRLSGTILTGGQPISGPPSVGRIDGGGWWVAEMEDVPVNGVSNVRAYRALIADWEAFGEAVVVPVFDEAPQPTFYRFDDGTGFSDGTLWVDGGLDCELETDAALRATSLDVRVLSGAGPEAGMYFAVVGEDGAPRLHMITKITDESLPLVTVRIAPPLRTALPSGTPLDFANPRLVMNLDERGDGHWGYLEPPFKMRTSLAFNEAFSWFP